nr:TonB-dependent receptor [Pontibacter sp. 172403-2]
MALAQGVTVQGKVTDESGMGLPGVTVLLKGTNTAAPTGADGAYTINVPDGSGTLVFSFIGYQTQEVPINNRSTVNVQLGADTKALEEVVVVGYGTQKKETVTGSVAAVKGAELEKSPAVNLTNSIAGRMPGVVAVNRSGEPGYDGSSIRIRGSNTLGSNGALVVIDGIPARAGGIERLNPADIESISVLKDASAAIYGSRAANGVILVTTKRGTVGKPELSYSFNQGFAQPTVIPELTDAVQFGEMRNDLEIYNRVPVPLWEEAKEAFRQSGSYTLPDGAVVNAHYSPEDFQKFRDGSNPWTHPNTDWYDATLKEWSPQSQHNLQLTGGSENIKFLTSLGYVNQDAFYKNSATGYKQYDLRINLDANISKYIKTSIGMLGRQENRFFPTVSAGAIFRMQMRGIPTSPAYWPNGKPGPDIENGQNPVVITTNKTGYDRDTRSYLQTNGSVEITNPWIEGLKFTGTAAVDKMTRRTKRWQIPWYLYDWDKATYEADGVTPLLTAGRRGPADPNLTMGDEEELKILLGGILTFERSFGDHAVTVLAGTNRETIEGDWFNAYRRYFISPAIDQLAVGGDLEKSNNGDAVERARLSHFGRFAYNYKEKYMAEFLWRYDASDIFPRDTRYGFFPGVLAAWRISEEDFFKNNVSFINSLKLRGSWGQMGNDDIGELYSYLSLNQFSSYIIGGQEVKTLRETRVPNPTITWEVANNTDIGLEGQMLQGKINFEFDVFYNKRTSILWAKYGSVPQTTGMTLPRQNIGEVANKGWEFLIGYNNQFGDVSFNVSANGGYAKNEILFWDEAPGAPAHQRSTGMPMGTGLRYEYDGVFPDQASIDANPLDYSAIVGTLRPGDMKYKDISGPDGVPDGKITPDDRTRDPRNDIPTFQGGLSANLGYKNFDFSVLFQGSAGAVTTIGTGEMGSIGNFLEDIYVNRWTVDNHSSVHPRIADRGNQYYSGGNTYWMRSTDYIRLKNIELGYTLPVEIGQKIGLSALRVYVNALNLATWDKLKVYDPENVNANGQYYPQSRVINGGVTVTF